MGCPDFYYKRILQSFAHCLALEDGSSSIAKRLSDEESVTILEAFIRQIKVKMNDKLFFYNAGRVSQTVFNEAYAEGIDAMNSSISGLIEFECFIGVRCNDDSN